jgi:hypothetical protein
MEAVQTSETLVNSYQSAQHYNPEDSHLQTHCHENLETYYVIIVLVCENSFILDIHRHSKVKTGEE